MKRRTLLCVGLGGAAVLTLAGGGLSLLQPGIRAGHLTNGGRDLFAAIARAVLDGVLPDGAEPQRRAIDAYLARLDATVAGLPPAARAELSQLLALMTAAPGRWALCGLRADWSDAEVRDVQAALGRMRVSSLALRQQTYHALRNLTNAAYFADPGTWGVLGYPGQRALA